MRRRFFSAAVAFCCIMLLTKAVGIQRGQATDTPSGEGQPMEVNYRGLSVSAAGDLLLNGDPYRGIGVNYFNAFTRTLDDGQCDNTSYREGFAYLKERKIPFVRFAVNGYWPKNWDLYRYNPHRFFQHLDAFVKAAEEYGIGLIPSFFWHTPTVPDLVGEPVNQWGNRDSETTAFMRKFVKEIVVRYRDSPAIWGWEQGNEVNLLVDLPGDNEHLPPVVPELGTPSSRTKQDKLYTPDLRVMMAEFAREVRRHDGSRIVITGNAISRPAAYHLWHHQTWHKDTEDQYHEILAAQNPDPIDVISIHLYPGSAEEGYFVGENADLDQLIAASMAASRLHGKPLFIGEFGAQEALYGAEVTREKYRALLSSIERNAVPLAAMWVFDYPPHDNEEGINVGPNHGPREYMLQEIMEMNERLRQATNN